MLFEASFCLELGSCLVAFVNSDNLFSCTELNLPLGDLNENWFVFSSAFLRDILKLLEVVTVMGLLCTF